MTHGVADLAGLIAAAQEHEATVAASLADRRTRLPLRFWAQQAHFTVPAGDATLARKALHDGTAPMSRILDRLGVSSDSLAELLGVDAARVTDLLEHPRQAPLVMLDGEDAQPLRSDVIDAGLQNAVELLSVSPSIPGRLAFFRPPGFGLGTTARDLFTLLDGVASADPERFALDGIVMPKLEHPEQVDLLFRHLEAAEASIGIEQGTIRVGILDRIRVGVREPRGPGASRGPSPELDHLRTGRLLGGPGSRRDPHRAPRGRRRPGRHRGGRGWRRGACHRRHDHRLSGSRPEPGSGRRPRKVPRADRVGPRRRQTVDLDGHVGQVGRTSGPALRRAARVRRGLSARHSSRPKPARSRRTSTPWTWRAAGPR